MKLFMGKKFFEKLVNISVKRNNERGRWGINHKVGGSLKNLWVFQSKETMKEEDEVSITKLEEVRKTCGYSFKRNHDRGRPGIRHDIG